MTPHYRVPINECQEEQSKRGKCDVSDVSINKAGLELASFWRYLFLV